MSCITATLPPFPTLPSGITLTPPVPPPIPGFNLCCIRALPPIPLPSIPAILIVSGVLAGINATLVAVQAYVDQVAASLFDCPID